MTSRYVCRVTGKNYERFLKTMKRLSIPIYAISYLDKSMQIEVDETGFSKLKKLKTTYKIEVISYKGKAKISFFLKKYRTFFSACIFGVLILLFLSNLIWKVEIIHTKQEIRTLLYDVLKEKGIKPFAFKPTFARKEQIKEEILETYKDKIEWLEIEEVGTKYIVRVEERKMNLEKEKTTPQNIIAKKDAMILSITADQGEVIKKKFDYVKKGDVLISGVIHKNEEAKSKVRAEGTVFGEVWYTVSVLLPINYQEEKVIGSPKRKVVFHFLDHTYIIENETYRVTKALPIFRSYLLPISLSLETIEKVQLLTKHYDLESGEKEGISLAIEKLRLRLPENSEITAQKVLKKKRKGSKIYIEVFFKVKEEITAYESIASLDLSKEKDAQEETR